MCAAKLCLLCGPGWGDDSDEEELPASAKEAARIKSEIEREKHHLQVCVSPWVPIPQGGRALIATRQGYESLMRMAKKGSKERQNAERLAEAAKAKIARMEKELISVTGQPADENNTGDWI